MINLKSTSKNRLTLKFHDQELEDEFNANYDANVRLPLRLGIIISILIWFFSLGLIYFVIPEKMSWLAPITIVYIGSYFGFVVYATYFERFKGYYHLFGAISNAWGGLYAIYFCSQFPTGANLTLPALIFIVFFGSYLIKLKWVACFIAPLTYTVGYTIHSIFFSELDRNQIILYVFVIWMTLIFAVLAGRMSEASNRLAFVQKKTIAEQNKMIEGEKKILLQEVHHRVQNNLQIIVSLMNLQISFSDSTKMEYSLSAARNRLLSMSLIHRQVKNAGDFTEISLSEYTRTLIDHLGAHFNGKKENYELDIPKHISLEIERSITFGLFLNEMISNFYLHSDSVRPTAKKFKLKIDYTKEGEIKVHYSDNGNGFPKETLGNMDDSLGLLVMSSLSEQLDGQFNISNDGGAVYQLSFSKISIYQ